MRLCIVYVLVFGFTILNERVLAKEDKYAEQLNKKLKDHPDTQNMKKLGGKLNHNQKDDKPFRTDKLNQLWQKAQKKFDKDDPAIKQLFKDFLSQDKLEMDLKRKKGEGRDETGEYDAIVRQKLLDILESYDLAQYAPEEGTKLKAENESLDKSDLQKNSGYAIKDKRLSKIWQKASTLGFSAEELIDLKTELIHQQKKVDEYNILKNEVADMDNVHENSIDRFKRSEEDEKAIHQKKMDLKRKFQEMKDGYQFLEASAQERSEKSLDFTDPRVIDLWLQIKKGNFSSKELEGFKEELQHFERKIHKHQYLKKEYSASVDEKMNADTGQVKIRKEEKMERKLDEYDRKIKKTYNELKHRITQALGHTEL